MSPVGTRGLKELYLYTAEEAVGRHISFIYPEDQLEFLEHDVIGPLKEKGVHESEVRLRRKSGEEFHALLLLSLLRDGSGAPTGMVGSSIDISARKKADELIRLGKEEWEQTFDAMPDMVAVIDKEHVIRRANKALTAKLGIDWNELIGRHCYRSYLRLGKTAFQLLRQHGDPHRQGEDRGEIRREIEGALSYKLHSNIRLRQRQQYPVLLKCGGTSPRQKETEKKLYEAANTDILTGLYNRRGFIALAEHQLRVADRERKNLILVYIGFGRHEENQ